MRRAKLSFNCERTLFTSRPSFEASSGVCFKSPMPGRSLALGWMPSSAPLRLTARQASIGDSLTGRLKRDRPRYVWIKKGPQGEETRVERWETYGFIEQGFNGEIYLLLEHTAGGKIVRLVPAD